MLRARAFLLQRGPKLNPHVSADPGASFEQYTKMFEDNLKFKPEDGRSYKDMWGQYHHTQEKVDFQQDFQGTVPERPAAQMAKAMFQGFDPNHRASKAVNNPTAKAQNQQVRKWDKNAVKTSREAGEYYYTPETLQEKRARRLKVGLGAAGGTAVIGWLSVALLNRYFPDS